MSINDIYIEKKLMDYNHNIVKNKPSENVRSSTGNKNRFRDKVYKKLDEKITNLGNTVRDKFGKR